MANLSAVKAHCKDRRSKSPPSPPSSDSTREEDERSLPNQLEGLVFTALNAPLSAGAALSASSLAPVLRRVISIPSIRFTNLDKSMPPSRSVHLLIASLGNPAPYHGTRHSAGHVLLKALASHVNAPPLHKLREYGGLATSTTTEQGTQWTFFQSPSLMNVSGPAVLKALKTFTAQFPRSEDYECGLVVLHDELELAPGKMNVKKGDSSSKGHNGIKSVQASLQGAGLTESFGSRFIKVGVGIGRPISRDRDEVSGYVLGQLTGGERLKIEGAAEALLAVLLKEAQKMSR